VSKKFGDFVQALYSMDGRKGVWRSGSYEPEDIRTPNEQYPLERGIRVDMYVDKYDIDKVLNRELEPIKSIPYTINKPLKEIGEYIRYTVIPRRFNTGNRGGSGGEMWPRLKKPTIKWRKKYHKESAPILQPGIDPFPLFQRATSGLHVETSSGMRPRLRMWSNDSKVIVHQHGEGKIPPRPFIPEEWDDFNQPEKYKVTKFLETYALSLRDTHSVDSKTSQAKFMDTLAKHWVASYKR
jgi:hypothetical protein